MGDRPPVPLLIIQTFRIHQKRTANISNSRTSTNHIGPSTRHRVIYRFRRRTNHHDSTIFSMSCLFIVISGCGAEGVLILNSNDVLHRSVHSPRSPPNCVHFIRSGLKSLVGTFSLRHALDLSSYLKPFILAISPYHQAHWIYRVRRSVSYLLERGMPT